MIEHFPINSKDFDGSVLVTGAGGCIGSWVLTLLIKAGVDVVAFDLSEEKHRLKLLLSNEDIKKIKWIKGDIVETQIVNEAVTENNIHYKISLLTNEASMRFDEVATYLNVSSNTSY